MPELSTETHIALMEAELRKLRREVDDMQAERSKALLWGIAALGAAVLGLVTFVLSLLGLTHKP